MTDVKEEVKVGICRRFSLQKSPWQHGSFEIWRCFLDMLNKYYGQSKARTAGSTKSGRGKRKAKRYISGLAKTRRTGFLVPYIKRKDQKKDGKSIRGSFEESFKNDDSVPDPRNPPDPEISKCKAVKSNSVRDLSENLERSKQICRGSSPSASGRLQVSVLGSSTQGRRDSLVLTRTCVRAYSYVRTCVCAYRTNACVTARIRM